MDYSNKRGWKEQYASTTGQCNMIPFVSKSINKKWKIRNMRRVKEEIKNSSAGQYNMITFDSLCIWEH